MTIEFHTATKKDNKMPNQDERLHALDALRAIMMLLGLVIHTAASYMTTDLGQGWPLKDVNSTHLSFDILSGYIHGFRMPIFFAVAGFFSALLFFNQSPKSMLLNRIKRILLPLLVFLLLLWPINAFIWTYGFSVMEHSASPWQDTWNTILNIKTYLPENTIHLWFLYYLVYFSFFGYLIGLLQNRFQKTSLGLQSIYNAMMKYPLIRPIIFATLTFVFLLSIENPLPEQQGQFIPNWQAFIFYFSFYVFGWFLFGSKHLISTLPKHSWKLLLLAIPTHLAFMALNATGKTELSILCVIHALSTWLFVFSIFGLFIRYFSQRSQLMRFISNGAYWIYLIHLPVVAFFTIALLGMEMHSSIKFLIVFLSSLFVCMISYRYWVQSSVISVFLNGRRF